MQRIKVKLDDAIGTGKPRRASTTLVFIFCGAYINTASSIVLTLVLTKENSGDRVEEIALILGSDFVGTLFSLLVAPFVDNTISHRIMVITSMAACSGATLIGLLVVAVLRLNYLIPIATLVLATQFAYAFFVAIMCNQLDDPIGTKTRLILVIYYTTSYFFKGVAQIVLFWQTQVVTKVAGVLIALSPLLMITYAIYAYAFKFNFIDAQCNRGDAFILLSCIVRSFKCTKKGIFFDRMLQYYNYAIVTQAIKSYKLMFICLATSLVETIEHKIDLLWIYHYVSVKRTNIFQYIEFNALSSFLTSILLPLAEICLVPALRKIKVRIPLFSMMISLGYILLALSFGSSLWVQYATESTRSKRLDHSHARVYLYNALDTYTHVWSVSVSDYKTTVPSGSMVSLRLRVTEGEDLELRAVNPWYSIQYKMNLSHVTPLTTAAYVLTTSGAYAVPSKGFIRQSTPAPKLPADTTLAFICPKEHVNRTYEFPSWCNSSVFIHDDLQPLRNEKCHMLEMGDASVIAVPPDNSFKVIMHFEKDVNHNLEPLNFLPLQGGKYFFVMWRGDVHLKVKYRILQLLEPFPVTAIVALPQVFLRALGNAVYRVSITAVFIVNIPPPLLSSLWAFRLVSTKLFAPIILALAAMEYRDAKHQAPFFFVEVILFFVLLVALRAARYHK